MIARVTAPMGRVRDPVDDADQDTMRLPIRVDRWVHLAAESVAEAGIAVAQHHEAHEELGDFFASLRAGGRPSGGIVRLKIGLAVRAFVFAVSNATTAVERISSDIQRASYDDTVKQRVDLAATALAAAFPWARDARDTYAHLEDRVLGRRRNETIRNQPADIPGWTGRGEPSSGSFIQVGDASGTSVTLGDGSQALIAVTDESAELLCARVQAVIDSLPWEDPDRSPWVPRPS